MWLAAVALTALLTGLIAGWTPLLPVAVGLLGAIYASHLRVDHVALDLRAPAIAAGLFVTAELGYWSLDEREGICGEPGEGLRRASVIAALAVVAVLAGAAVLALADVMRVRGLAIDLVGALAAVGVVLAVLAAARGQSSSGS